MRTEICAAVLTAKHFFLRVYRKQYFLRVYRKQYFLRVYRKQYFLRVYRNNIYQIFNLQNKSKGKLYINTVPRQFKRSPLIFRDKNQNRKKHILFRKKIEKSFVYTKHILLRF